MAMDDICSSTGLIRPPRLPPVVYGLHHPSPPSQIGGRVRIAHVNDIAHVASELARAQRLLGLDAVVVDPMKPGGLLPSPLKVFTLPVRVGMLLQLAWRLRRGRYDLIHIHYATHGLLGRLVGRPFIVHCHGTDVRFARPRSIKGRYLGWVMRHAAGVLYSTPDLREWVVPLRSDARFMPNPIDTERFAPGQRPEDDLLIGVRLHPIKGASVAIEALAAILRQRPDARITVIEDGPLSGAVRERFRGRIRLEPPREHVDMPSLLRRHKVALGQFRLGILSQFELEAMAVGVALVADLRSIDDYPARPPVRLARDATAVATAVSALLDDDRSRVALAETGRDWVARHHGAAAVADSTRDVYLRCLRPTGP